MVAAPGKGATPVDIRSIVDISIVRKGVTEVTPVSIFILKKNNMRKAKVLKLKVTKMFSLKLRKCKQKKRSPVSAKVCV